jgi:hypothetical protein
MDCPDNPHRVARSGMLYLKLGIPRTNFWKIVGHAIHAKPAGAHFRSACRWLVENCILHAMICSEPSLDA